MAICLSGYLVHYLKRKKTGYLANHLRQKCQAPGHLVGLLHIVSGHLRLHLRLACTSTSAGHLHLQLRIADHLHLHLHWPLAPRPSCSQLVGSRTKVASLVLERPVWPSLTSLRLCLPVAVFFLAASTPCHLRCALLLGPCGQGGPWGYAAEAIAGGP